MGEGVFDVGRVDRCGKGMTGRCGKTVTWRGTGKNCGEICRADGPPKRGRVGDGRRRWR